MLRSTLVVVLLALPVAAAQSQGTLASQGFGYPFGQLSTRALATGGGMGEFDPYSTLNPATVAATGRRALHLQYEPEYRRITAEDVSDAQRFVRFPMASGIIPVGPRFAMGFSFSTLLDRTGQSSDVRTETVGGEEVTFEETTRSNGAINDLRLVAAYDLGANVRVGLGVHAITGEFRQFLGRTFETPGFDTLSVSSRASFSGLAFSGGVMWQPAPGLTLAGSGRWGSGIEAFVNDTARTEADVPHRVGIGVGVERIAGVALSAHASWEGWSSFEGLGSAAVNVHDTKTYGVGAEIAGPSVFGTELPLRVGYRWRELPFSPEAEQVTESAFAGGIGIPLLGGFSAIDIGVQRASRSSGPYRERSLILSVGVTVHP